MRTPRYVAAGLAGALVLGGLAAGTAHATTNSVHLYGQVNNNSLSGNQDLSDARVLTLTVSPTTAVTGTRIEVKVSTPADPASGGVNLCNGPAAAAPIGEEEADAVIVLNGTQYVLHGPRNTVAVPSSPYATSHPPACAHALVNAGWVISSTAGHSSGTSDVSSTPTTKGTGTTTYNHTTGALGSAVSLSAPSTAGSYTIGLKAIVVNAVAGTSTPGLYDDFDEFMNIDATSACANPATCAVDNTTTFPGPGGTPNAATNAGSVGNGSFYNDTASAYISAAPGWAPVTLKAVKDTTRPAVSLTVPSRSNVGTSWRTLKGKVTDGGSGPKSVTVQLVDKKSGHYYAWTGTKWSKKSSKAKAVAGARKLPATLKGTSWSRKGTTAPKKSTLTVIYSATDKAGNRSSTKAYSKSITR